MPPTSESRPFVLAGFLLGIVGMVGFGVYHWFYVAPVASVFIEGILFGGGAGALVGRAYHRAIVLPGRRGWRADFAFGAVMVGALIPYEIVGLVWGPFAEITRPSQILPMLPVTLLGIPVLAVGGYALTRSKKATTAIVLAGFVLHFFIGGSAAHFGGRGQTLVLVLGMGAFELACSLLIGPLGRGLQGRSHPPALPTPR